MVVGADESFFGPWAFRLRWGLAAVLAASLPVSSGPLGLRVAWGVALPAIALLAGANLWLVHRAKRGLTGGAGMAVAGAILDMTVVATVLGASGGAANPFTALLFVHVALAASLMPARRAFLVAAFGAASFGALFALPTDPACHVPEGSTFTAHLYGMWAAYAVGAVLVTIVSTELRRTLIARSKQIEQLRAVAEADSRFAAIGTLAAGAAHELNTPLGTVAVLSSELDDPRYPEDVRQLGRSIRAEVERCRDVVRKLQPGATQRPMSEAVVGLDEVVSDALQAWRRAHPDAVVELRSLATAKVSLAREDLAAAVNVLLDNAWEATREAGRTEPIVVTIERDDGEAVVRVRDAGTGFDASTLSRLGEPFVSSKPAGEGMGLGLFLVRGFLADVGGRLVATSVARGADVAMHLRATFAEAP